MTWKQKLTVGVCLLLALFILFSIPTWILGPEPGLHDQPATQGR